MTDAEILESRGLRVKVWGENFLKVWDARKSAWICYYPSSGSFHYDRGSALGRGLESLLAYLGIGTPPPADRGGITEEFLDHALAVAKANPGVEADIILDLVTFVRAHFK